jgi:hypothetical protein
MTSSFLYVNSIIGWLKAAIHRGTIEVADPDWSDQYLSSQYIS